MPEVVIVCVCVRTHVLCVSTYGTHVCIFVCVNVRPSNTVTNNPAPALLSSFISLCSPIAIPTCASLQTCCSIPRYFLPLKETRSKSPV